MSKHGAIELSWNGGDHVFRLGLAEIEELESETDMSVFLLHAAMQADVPFARLKHYSATIRLGLVGGGMSPLDARALTRRHVDQRPLLESVVIGREILAAGLARVHSPTPEEGLGEPEAPMSSASTSAPSMETQP